MVYKHCKHLGMSQSPRAEQSRNRKNSRGVEFGSENGVEAPG